MQLLLFLALTFGPLPEVTLPPGVTMTKLVADDYVLRPPCKAILWSAKWCGPCHVMEPIIAELVKDGWAVEEYDIDKHSREARLWDVRAVPALTLYDQDTRLVRFEGQVPKSWLQELFARLPVLRKLPKVRKGSP